MKIISGLTTYFSHSNYGQHHLKAEMAKEKDKRGIQVGGVTRFSTFSTHAKSTLPAVSMPLSAAWHQVLSPLTPRL
jgi:hypothetical protein